MHVHRKQTKKHKKNKNKKNDKTQEPKNKQTNKQTNQKKMKQKTRKHKTPYLRTGFTWASAELLPILAAEPARIRIRDSHGMGSTLHGVAKKEKEQLISWQ